MSKTIGICAWAALVAATSVAFGQESPAAQPPPAEPAPGPRLRVEFRETREKGSTTTTRTSVLVLHADAEGAWVFVGPQVAMTTSNQGTLTTQFKNAGVGVHASVKALSEDRYRLDASFEDSSTLATGDPPSPGAAENPIFRIVRGESRLTVGEGETVPFASAVDPVSGEVVRVDVTITAAPASKPVAAVGGENSRLRARLVLVRRQGQTTVARRPYSVVLDAGGENAANAFGGSMLPVQVNFKGQTMVQLKDVGAGLRLTAHRIPDGRFRLDLGFSDGVLSPAEGSPRLHVFETESQLFVAEGETVTVGSAVDPETGEVVEAQLTLERVR